ncbi:MAG TPA: type II toxin-antitoxin system VapC family toxin [Gemmataceae bacterium]|nr:type II toxin-antitoxin system VapC family toxin [Gemmataceae bacterium]
MHVLDTDTLSFWFKGDARVMRRLQEAGESGVVTTIVSRIETLRGRFDQLFKAANAAEFLRAQERLTRTDEFLGRMLILPLDAAAVAEFERLVTLKGLKKIGRGDLLIASIALAHGATLVSRNLRDFQRIPDLSVVNWVD